jgi:glutathione S-transferase
MTTLFEITTLDDIRPSPFCWRVRLALKHKRVPFDTVGISYSQIPTLGDGSFKAMPVLQDRLAWIEGSSRIADTLESEYPQQPTLFPADPERRFARFVETWVESALHTTIFRLVAFDVWKRLHPTERAYFRSTREQRLGTTLEYAHEAALARLDEFPAALEPLRRVLLTRQFLSGHEPAYPDYLVFAALKWQRLVSDVVLLPAKDSVEDWYTRLDQLAQE